MLHFQSLLTLPFLHVSGMLRFYCCFSYLLLLYEEFWISISPLQPFYPRFMCPIYFLFFSLSSHSFLISIISSSIYSKFIYWNNFVNVSIFLVICCFIFSKNSLFHFLSFNRRIWMSLFTPFSSIKRCLPTIVYLLITYFIMCLHPPECKWSLPKFYTRVQVKNYRCIVWSYRD